MLETKTSMAKIRQNWNNEIFKRSTEKAQEENLKKDLCPAVRYVSINNNRKRVKNSSKHKRFLTVELAFYEFCQIKFSFR